jgi:recombination protein RecA
MFNEGVSKIGEIIDIGVEKNIVEKSGAWFSYSGTRIGQGRENVKVFLAEHPEMAAEIELKVRQAAGLPTGSAPAGDNGSAAKDAAPQGERGGRSSKGQKPEKHAEE